MANFYDDWVGFWDKGNEAKAEARTSIHEEELEWVETDQDFRVALMAAPENGFATWGSEYLISEIPPGWHSGEHEHGEEAIYIVEGEGFSIVNGVKYEWNKHSVLWMPFGSRHQHFNTGTETVRYFSAMALHIEHWMGMGKLDQISLKGPTDNYEDAEVSTTGFDALNRRISLREEEQVEITLDDVSAEEMAEISGEATAIDPDGVRPTQMTQHGHRDFTRRLMDREGKNGFQNKEVEISTLMGDQVGHHGGKHAHMEAVLYMVNGQGYSEVGGVKVPWKKGSLIHVQGPQTPHQHFNTGTERVEMLRAAPGMRFNFMQPIAKERFPYLWFTHRGVNDSSVTNPWA